MITDTNADGNTERCFGRLKARELSPEERDAVSGGDISYTGISVSHYDSNGDPQYESSDSGDVPPRGQ